MKISTLIGIVFFSTQVFSQKFVVIENKGENAKYFNYKDTNSFVGVLMNNLVFIPEMVSSNQFQGVYDENTLGSLSVSKESMLTFEKASESLKITNPTNDDIINLIKTHQSLDVFLDSLKPILDYENLFTLDRNSLQEYWNDTQIGYNLTKYETYYYDIRNLSAFLLEEKDQEIWIHFIKQNENGKNFISLSLKKDQLMESSCFNFWKFLTDEESKEFISTYKSEVFKQLESEEFNRWINGFPDNFYIINETISFNESSCWNSSGKIKESKDAGHPFSSEEISSSDIQETRKTQAIGSMIQIERREVGDMITLTKTNNTLLEYLDSVGIHNDEAFLLLSFHRTNLQGLWDRTKIGDDLRLPKDSLLVWKETPNAKTAISFTLRENGTEPTIRKAYIYMDKNGQKIPVICCNIDFLNSAQQFPNTEGFINKIKINTSDIIHWNSILQTSTIKQSFSEIQKALNLINNSTNLN
jgi:hypothetical protein